MAFKEYTTKNLQDIYQEFNVTSKGLSLDQVEINLQKHGYNQLKKLEVRWWHIFFRQFKSSFIYLLILAAVIAFYLESHLDSAMILLFVFINALLGFYQEFRSEQTLKLLKKYIKRQIKVRRANKEILIDSQELVPGDIVIIEAGDIIPADIRFIKENNLIIDESILTGESVPVKKICHKLAKPAKEIYQASNIGFSGTTVVSGEAEGIVLATGEHMVIGEISKLAIATKRESSFEKGVNKISKFILRLIILTLVFIFLANLYIKGENANTVELLIFSIALAVSVIPEALPIVTTFSLSRGAMRLAKNKVVVKRLSAIEDLGSVEILCTDKTGTLTENNLEIAETFSANPQETIFYACLASSFITEKNKQPNNAFDLALFKKLSVKEKNDFNNYQTLDAFPFDPDRKRNSILIKHKAEKELIVRGAPEIIINYCSNLNQREKKTILNWISQEGRQGRRILAVAKKTFLKHHQYTIKEEENDLNFLGMISFVDPIKKSTKAAIAQAERLGLDIKILTGDSKEVAGAVAYEVGLVNSAQSVLTGEELDQLSGKKQQEAVYQYNVFARVSPQQKYKIIQLLQKDKEVGFLGEGINDAPSLKIANVAIVVQGATDVAREAADIILLNKSLAVIVDGIKEGREVFANTIKYIKATLSSNFGNFYAIAIVSLFIDFLPMLPLQILLVNLLSDFPMIAVSTDTIEAEELKKPKSYNIKEIALLSSIFGIISSIFDFTFFVIFFRFGPHILQTGWFMESILTELIFIFSIRSKRIFFKAKKPSKTLIGLTGFAFLATIIIPFTNLGQKIFKFVNLSSKQLLLILAIVIVYFIINEIIKNFYYSIFNNKKSAKIIT